MHRHAIVRIVAPTLVTALLFVVAIYVLLIPALERAVMDRKREMIRELTVSAWNILANYEELARAGALTGGQAREQAVAQLRHLHYGAHQKDYFWINDLQPRMIMHPYRGELEGRDLADYADPDGRLLFVEAADLVRREGEGFLAYRWQRRDHADEVVAKISFVKGFEPWGWLIGTGIYIDDVQAEIRSMTRRLTLASSGILAVISVLLGFIVAESLRIERRRRTAEEALARAAAALRDRVGALEQAEARQARTIAELRGAVDLLLPAAAGSRFEALRGLAQADTPEDLAERNQALPALLHTVIENGARAVAANRLLAANGDLVTSRLLAFALRDLGPPPVPFTFLLMGSQGRREQTLRTDQDNALLYQDPPPEAAAACAAYFLALGARVCDGLAAAGYAACEGGIMARNPPWCRPLADWKARCAAWIAGLEAEDLLQAKIFFDYRPVHGETRLAEELAASIRDACEGSARFFPQLARTILLYTPPLGLFGRLAAEARDGQGRGLDLKEPMTAIADFARIYALRHRLAATSTAERLAALARDGVLSPSSAGELIQTYEALMDLRVRHQLRLLAAGRAPDNFIDLDSLTRLDRRVLQEAFGQIRVFQSRVGYDFTGASGSLA